MPKFQIMCVYDYKNVRKRIKYGSCCAYIANQIPRICISANQKPFMVYLILNKRADAFHINKYVKCFKKD